MMEMNDEAVRTVLDFRAQQLARRGSRELRQRGTEVVVVTIGAYRFAVDVARVESVAPVVQVLSVPGAAAWNAGIVLHEGLPVCLVDVPALLGGEPIPVCNVMLLVATKSGVLALGASELVGLRRFEDSELTPPPESGGVGFVSFVGADLTRVIDPDQLAADPRVREGALSDHQEGVTR